MLKMLNPRILYSKRYINTINAVLKLNKLQIKESSNSSLKIWRDARPIEETVTGRFLMYFDCDKSMSNDKIKKATKHQNKINRSSNLLDNFNERKIKSLDLNGIIECLNCLKYNSKSKSSLDLVRCLTIIDKECCDRVNKLSTLEVLKLLQVYTISCYQSYQILNYKFYHAAVNYLTNNLYSLQKNEIIQLMFFISLEKKKYISQSRIFKCLRRLYNEKTIMDTLNAEDLRIICVSIFKTSLKLVKFPKFLEKVHDFINNNLWILNDPDLFTTLIKTIRQNRFQSDDLMTTVSCAIFFNNALNNYNFIELCHILALFADYNYHDKVIFEHFTKNCLEQLKSAKETNFEPSSNYISCEIRDKDIHRFLWCLCTINYKFNEIFNEKHIRETIVPFVIDQFKSGKFYKNPGRLLEIYLYLWMLNYRSKELIPYVFNAKYIKQIRASPGPSKQRLNTLLTIIYHEDRPLFNQLNLKTEGRNEYNVENQIKRRPALQRVFVTLNSLKSQIKMSHFEMNLAVPYLNVAGITGYKDNEKIVFVEVLDEFTTLKNVDEGKVIPTGTMQTKLRIVNGFEQGFVTVNAVDIERMTEAELKKYLLDEINLVCI